jgi:hypothetical protein
MATLSQIRAAIKAKMESVPEIGRVHDRERYAKDMAKLKALFEWPGEGSGKLRGWIIRRVSTRESSSALGRTHCLDRWQIRGYQGFSDEAASEIEFDDRIEAIRDAFRADETLGGVVSQTVDPASKLAFIQVDDSGPVMFAGLLCHGARLSLITSHYK